MNRGVSLILANQSVRRFVWMRRALALTCLALWACVASSSGTGTPKPPPDSPLNASPAIAAEVPSGALEFVPASDSRAELQGDTTIGPWSSSSTDIQGKFIVNVDAKVLDALFDHIQADSNKPSSDDPPLALAVRSSPIADISVPVKSLQGSSGGMDRDMQHALKADQYPSIEYVYSQLQQATVQIDSKSGRPSVNLRLAGTLAMAGAVRPISMDVIITRTSPGHFRAHAQTSMKMTDFGVTPPVALFGLIKAGDDVNVDFDLDLVPAN